MGLLSGKVAIVTGANSGIGRAAAKLFASEGACIVANARGSEPLARLAAEIQADGGRCTIVAGDICDEQTHDACVKAALETFGALDIGFNNA
jgi:NAD(P)-dependent dehydrogenase (short-subunit alcohol dehydrogenase family)